MDDKINRGIAWEEETPFDTPVRVEQPAQHNSADLYVLLFHGRNSPQETLDDWGFDGPIIGPVGISWTYGCIKLHDQEWQGLEFLPMHNDLVLWEGKYYGDFEIMQGDDPKLAVARQTRQVVDFAQFYQKVNS